MKAYKDTKELIESAIPSKPIAMKGSRIRRFMIMLRQLITWFRTGLLRCDECGRFVLSESQIPTLLGPVYQYKTMFDETNSPIWCPGCYAYFNSVNLLGDEVKVSLLEAIVKDKELAVQRAAMVAEVESGIFEGIDLDAIKTVEMAAAGD